METKKFKCAICDREFLTFKGSRIHERFHDINYKNEFIKNCHTESSNKRRSETMLNMYKTKNDLIKSLLIKIKDMESSAT